MFMHVIDAFWYMQPLGARFIVLILFGVVLVSLVRFTRLALRLYYRPVTLVMPEAMVKGIADPVSVARFALASRGLDRIAPKEGADVGFGMDSAARGRGLDLVRRAEAEFLCLWGKCHADVESAKRAAELTAVLAVVIPALWARRTFDDICNNSNLTGETCLYLTADQLITRLGAGLLLCAILYAGSSFFERALHDRRCNWNYFCARVKDVLSRE